METHLPTIPQIRAARAYLDWTGVDLARHAGISLIMVRRIENRHYESENLLGKMTRALERAGVRFTSHGVELRP